METEDFPLKGTARHCHRVKEDQCILRAVCTGWHVSWVAVCIMWHVKWRAVCTVWHLSWVLARDGKGKVEKKINHKGCQHQAAESWNW